MSFVYYVANTVNPKPLPDLKNLQWFDFAGEVAGIYGVIKRLSLLNYPRSKIGNFRQTIASGLYTR